jgi:hypothetical protein
MSLAISALLFGFSFLTAMTFLTFLSAFKPIENRFFRTLTGGSVGGLSASYLDGVKPTLSFIEASLNGDFGFGGYAMLLSLTLMLFVWSYNLFRYGGVVR